MSAAVLPIQRSFQALVLDLTNAKARRHDLTMTIDRELSDDELTAWDRLDDRVAALEAEVGVSLARFAGVTWDQLERAMS